MTFGTDGPAGPRPQWNRAARVTLTPDSSQRHAGANSDRALHLGRVAAGPGRLDRPRLVTPQAPAADETVNALQAGPTVPIPSIEDVTPLAEMAFGGIPRLADVHTTIPSRPRQEVIKYTVVAGDTVFGIAEKFGLKPETVLWSNYNVLLDNPHFLQPDQELNILPVDGTYHQWQQGEGLNGISAYYGVKPEDIIDYPANNLDPATIGDFTNPNIAPGTWLVVPGGHREYITWSAPLGVTRENPASARVLGPGAVRGAGSGATWATGLAGSSAASIGSIAGVTSGPSCRTTVLRMTFRSWRTLPGQGRLVSMAAAPGSKPVKSLPSSAANSRRLAWAMSMISSGRARSGGMWIGTTCRR